MSRAVQGRSPERDFWSNTIQYILRNNLDDEIKS